jgi:nucleoside-diphosphate-sugar epimerase
MKAFVTGGTGFIGGWLIRELLAREYSVAALVRTFERAHQLPPGVRAIPGDVTKPESFISALRHSDVVFHLAGVTQIGLKPRDYPRVQRINVTGARNVLEAAAEAGVPKIVYVSSITVYGDTRGQVVDDGYRAAGATFETHAQRTQHTAHFEIALPMQQRGVPLTIAVPGTVYGPGELAPMFRLLRRHARGRLPILLGPDNARAWTYVEDVAAGLRLLAEQGRAGESYTLAGPGHTYRDFFAECARASGVAAPLLWLPSALARLGARVFERPLPALAERLRVLSGVTYLARSEKAARELNWQSRSLADGLRATFAWLREMG